jgi:hypothetical protein
MHYKSNLLAGIPGEAGSRKVFSLAEYLVMNKVVANV